MKVYQVTKKTLNEISKSLDVPILKGSKYIFINLPKTPIRTKYRLIFVSSQAGG